METSNRVGELHSTREWGDLVITKYLGNRSVYVKFLATGYEVKTSYHSIRKGCVRDRMLPSVHGVGVIGKEPISENGKKHKEYELWCSMLLRCYDVKKHLDNPTYMGCAVSENFKYYPYFKEWCNKQIGFDQEGWHLDKDILVKGNKLYSEDTCCFVPPEINVLLTSNKVNRGYLPVGVTCRGKILRFRATVGVGGKNISLGTYSTPEEAFRVYKVSKEKHIKDVANKWKEYLDIRVYEALMNYEVEIDD